MIGFWVGGGASNCRLTLFAGPLTNFVNQVSNGNERRRAQEYFVSWRCGNKNLGDVKLGWVGISVCERVHEDFALCVKFAHARNMSQNTATDRIKTRAPYKPCTGTDHSPKSTCHVTTRVHYVHAAYARVRHSLGQQTAEQTFSYKNESLILLFWSVH